MIRLRVPSAIPADAATPCRSGIDPDMWFEAATADQAIAWCRSCPFLTPCRAEATARGERWGVWGGLHFGADHGSALTAARRTIYARRGAARRHACAGCGDRPGARWFPPTEGGLDASADRWEPRCRACETATAQPATGAA